MIKVETHSIRLYINGLSQNLYPIGISVTSRIPAVIITDKMRGPVQYHTPNRFICLSLFLIRCLSFYKFIRFESNASPFFLNSFDSYPFLNFHEKEMPNRHRSSFSYVLTTLCSIIVFILTRFV